MGMVGQNGVEEADGGFGFYLLPQRKVRCAVSSVRGRTSVHGLKRKEG